MKTIYYRKRNVRFSYVFLLMISVICYGFSLKRVKSMFLDGEVKKTINVKTDKVVLDCSYEEFSSHYRITLHSLMYGKGFSVNPLSLSIVASNPNIIIEPVNRIEKKCESPAQIHSFYSIPSFKKTTHVSHEFDIIIKDSTDWDSVSLVIIPTDYLMYNGDAVITDTIMLTGAIPFRSQGRF